MKINKIQILVGALVLAIGVGFYVTSHKGATKYAPKAADTASEANNKHSSAPTNPPAAKAAQSEDKVNSISTPAEGGTVTSGTIVEGKTSSPQIYYRLKTASNGVVAGTGPINIKDGQFHFEILFNKEIKGGSDEGTLEVYTFSDRGVETSVASINVKVKG